MTLEQTQPLLWALLSLLLNRDLFFLAPLPQLTKTVAKQSR
jgi:hypothetical protein